MSKVPCHQCGKLCKLYGDTPEFQCCGECVEKANASWRETFDNLYGLQPHLKLNY